MSTKVTGKENNYRYVVSVSNIIVSRLQKKVFVFFNRDTCKLYRDTNSVTSIAMHRCIVPTLKNSDLSNDYKNVLESNKQNHIIMLSLLIWFIITNNTNILYSARSIKIKI